ncbi:HNH endonuclease [Corynebacterium sp. zg254]|uniref:HNH endonuclease n=1 Tax=Corynebacterium zhongnanshanii TaxID=2768834 RepID=A0ABQ6VG17_9CORY|nr:MULTISPECIES: HNH endonuclease signature motif containing protein [Corynebacterium]KAB3523354.1 HNH endonuclease [Corynebacterium zhongnanshanii]MCR5913523.1 HNH endonuclease [Corynebacterium sp. zg254]
MTTTYADRQRPPQRRPGSWRIEDTEDQLSCLARRINRDHIELLLMCTPEPEDYIPDFASRLVARAGLTRYQAEKYAMEALVLSFFPLLSGLFMSGVFTPRVVSRLLDDLSRVPERARADVERDLVAALEPRIQNQHCLSPRNAATKLEKILTSLCPEALPERPDEELHALTMRQVAEQTTAITLTTDSMTADAIDELIQATAHKYDVDPHIALEMLILGQADVRVTLNLYKNISTTARELFSAGGWLQGMVSEKWLERVTSVRTLGPSATEGYSPTDAQRAFVQARDGHCRFPGCEISAHMCEMDHIQRYAGGGPTHTDNLHLLCKHHHQLKTAGIWDVTRYADSGETWTSHGDGHTVSTLPDGPLARTTFKQRLSRRQANRRKKAPFEAPRPWDHMSHA